jgi:hypothetical protein
MSKSAQRCHNGRYGETDISYYVYVCRRGSFTNFSHGGPLDVRPALHSF